MKKLLWFSIVFNTVVLFACWSLFLSGSLESFPTEEDTSSARLVWGVLSGVFLVIEIIIFRRLKRINK